jgi:hypothetical protein
MMYTSRFTPVQLFDGPLVEALIRCEDVTDVVSAVGAREHLRRAEKDLRATAVLAAVLHVVDAEVVQLRPVRALEEREVHVYARPVERP